MLSRVRLLFLPLWVCVSNAVADDTTKSAMTLWVDSVYNVMSYEQKIGQLIVGKNETHESLETLVHQQFPLGGLDVPNGDANDIFKTTNLLKSTQSVPLLTIFSQSGNLDAAFPGTISYPSIFTKSSIDPASAELLEKKIIAVQKSLGINVATEKNLHLEIIHGEFFINTEVPWLGPRGNEITELKNELHQQSGILNAINLNISLFDYDFVKHIPKSVYESEGWKNIAEKHSIIFVNSLRFRSGWSANKFEKEIVKGLFRKKFEYEGVLAVATDAVAQQISPDQLKYTSLDVELINSGFDMIVTSDPVQAYKNLLFAYKNREIKSRDLEEKVKNILAKKYFIQKSKNRSLTEDYYAILNAPDVSNDIYEAYASSITLLKNDSEVIPVRHLETTNFASLMVGSEELSTFQETLGKYAPFTHFVLPAHDINSDSFANLLKKLSAFDNVVVGIRAPFHPKIVELLSQLKIETNLITAVFDNQLPDNVYGATNSLLISYEDNDLTQQLVPQMIFGARPCKGIYPGTDEELTTQGLFTEPLGRLAFAKSYQSGLDEATLTKIDAIAHEMVNMGAAPGCQVLVARHGNIVYDKTFGYYTYDSLVKVSGNTIYDVASITKVAATTQAIMFLANQGVLNLDEKLSTYLPELANTNKGNLIIRDVLSHQSGLRAFLPLWNETLNLEKIEIPYYSSYPDEEYSNEVAFGMYSNLALKDSIYSWTIKSDLRTKPRYRRYAPYDYKYSDLGFYFMYKLAERLLNQPMDEFLEQNFYQPMGMSGTAFNPLCNFPYMNMAPTEDDKFFRHNLVWGTVHDQIAAMNGGVSGHAGLFSNSLDLAKLGQMHLQGGTYGGQKYFDEHIIKEFTTSISKTNRRGLGWDKPEMKSDNNPASKYATGASYGHLGFTGTVIWIDPQYDLVYVFLSNRIFPSMSNNKLNIFNIRTRIHDAIYESIHNFEAKVN